MRAPIDYALAYARLGWRVMWAPQRLKYPVMKGWQENATTNMAVIEAWYRGDPGMNVCIVTGRDSGLWVLDIDNEPGKNGSPTLAALEKEHGGLPRTYAVGTGGGGVHYYWAWDGLDFDLPNTAGRLGVGLDIRANGGQVVAPPSWSEKGHYLVLDDAPVVPAPAWLIDLLRPVGPAQTVTLFHQPRGIGYANAALSNEVESVRTARPGQRNETLNRAAYALGRFIPSGELDGKNVAEALFNAAMECGLGALESKQTIASGLRKGACNVR